MFIYLSVVIAQPATCFTARNGRC